MSIGRQCEKTGRFVDKLIIGNKYVADIRWKLRADPKYELALVGLTDCIIATVAVHAVINGIDLDRNSSIVRAPVTLQVFLGTDDLETRDQIYGKISVDVEIEGANLTERDRAFLSEQAKRSNVSNLFPLAHDVVTTVRLK